MTDPGVQYLPAKPRRAVKKGVAERKSRHRIQQWVHARQPELNQRLVAASPTLASFLGSGDIEWRSPLARDDYREFRDELWAKLDLPAPSPQEAGWWPRNGPQWDAAAILHGTAGDGTLLVECKAWTGEDASHAGGGERSKALQRRAFAEVQDHLGAVGADWMGAQFQLANRLAFLYYLRCKLERPAWLALVYFMGESAPGADSARFPANEEQWPPAIDAGWHALGLNRGAHRLAGSVIEMYLPVFERPTPGELARAVPEAVRSDITCYFARDNAP